MIVAIATLVSVGRMIFGGGEESPQSPIATTTDGKDALKKTNADYSVRMTARGPIKANETARSYTITVSPNERNMTTYRGYVGDQIDSEDLDNNVQAYTQFVNALSQAGLMDGTPLSGAENNTNGVCASGYLYEFEVRQGSKVIEKLWTSSCKASPGSLDASVSQVNRLFQLQIPNFSKLQSKANNTSS